MTLFVLKLGSTSYSSVYLVVRVEKTWGLLSGSISVCEIDLVRSLPRVGRTGDFEEIAVPFAKI